MMHQHSGLRCISSAFVLCTLVRGEFIDSVGHCFIVSDQLAQVNGHGYMLEPPSRNSAWRAGFNTPLDVDDNGTNCGGFAVQTALGGRCGICGDAFNLTSKPSEAPGGMYATGTIVRSYRSAQTIPVSIVVTANHRGYFEFRLCANNNVEQDPVQDCFNRYLLIVVGSGTRYYLPTTVSQTFNVQLQLPMGVTCSQCIIQWTYTTGNNWGICDDGSQALGCGPQENFRACADISIAP